MFESVVRANLVRLLKVYDVMPYPVQNALTSARGLILARTRYSNSNTAYLQELEQREQWTSEQMWEFQRRSLQHVLDHARREVPYYRAYPVVEWRVPEDIRKLPVLPREVVRSKPYHFVSRESSNADCMHVGTTGTTGASLQVAYTEAVARRNWAFHMRRWAWAGVRPRSPRITFFGSRVVPTDRRDPPFWTHNLAEQQTLASIFHLSDHNAPHYIRFLTQNAGKVLEGFPSVLAILANFILKTGRRVPMRVVFTDGEPLYPTLRESIEHAFSTRVFDLYGNTELCGLIHECEEGRMHAISDYAFLEILDENDQPVESGQEGFLVWTGFVNETMPLIRYRIGDRGCWDPGPPCACERPFPVVVPTITRESDLLRCPDGRIFSPRALNQSLKGARSLRFCQIIHEQPGHVLIRGVASDPMAFEDVMVIRKNLQRILGDQISVSATLADAPIVRAGGKIPLVIQPQFTSPDESNERATEQATTAPV